MKDYLARLDKYKPQEYSRVPIPSSVPILISINVIRSLSALSLSLCVCHVSCSCKCCTHWQAKANRQEEADGREPMSVPRRGRSRCPSPSEKGGEGPPASPRRTSREKASASPGHTPEPNASLRLQKKRHFF
jgi:hypothetical protein